MIVKTISLEDFRKNYWERNALAFVMPGGRDLLYCRYLNGEGNKRIKTFVSNGGIYFGFCGGAYYGSRFVEFSPHTPIEVIGERELGFFPSFAKGPVFKPYDYNSSQGACSVLIDPVGASLKPFHVYYNGGCFFEKAEFFPEVKILGRYHDLPQKPAAVISCEVGEGIAFLSGVHMEYDPSTLKGQDPYLKAILPSLQRDNPERLYFLKKIIRFF